MHLFEMRLVGTQRYQMANNEQNVPRRLTCQSTKRWSVNTLLVAAFLLLFAFDANALPKIGFYKEKYSAGHGSFGCAHVTSNTRQVTVMGENVTYFEMTNADDDNANKISSNMGFDGAYEELTDHQSLEKQERIHARNVPQGSR